MGVGINAGAHWRTTGLCGQMMLYPGQEASCCASFCGLVFQGRKADVPRQFVQFHGELAEDRFSSLTAFP